jgi:hypothetical protein
MKIVLKIVILFTLTLWISIPCTAQTPESHYSTIIFPHNPDPYKADFAAGISLTILPRRIVEDQVRQLPMVDVRMRLGLPYQFALNARANLIYVTNQFTLGLSWTQSFDHFSFGLHNDASLWLGAMDFSGYDTYGLGIINSPGISIGTNIDDMYFTLRTDLLMQFYQKTIFGNDAVSRYKPEIAGVAFTFSVEQNLFFDHRILWGMRLQYARPQYEIWLAFYDVNIRLLTPQFFIAHIL